MWSYMWTRNFDGRCIQATWKYSIIWETSWETMRRRMTREPEGDVSVQYRALVFRESEASRLLDVRFKLVTMVGGLTSGGSLSRIALWLLLY